MKSKVFAEVLRTQLHKSLLILGEQFEAEFKIEEREFLELGKKVYGLMLTQMAGSGERRLWFRTYSIHAKSKNDVESIALSELFDVIIGNFLVNASRTDDATLKALSNTKHED